MNPIRLKDNNGGSLGKGFLFLMAQSPSPAALCLPPSWLHMVHPPSFLSHPVKEPALYVPGSPAHTGFPCWEELHGQALVTGPGQLHTRNGQG